MSFAAEEAPKVEAAAMVEKQLKAEKPVAKVNAAGALRVAVVGKERVVVCAVEEAGKAVKERPVDCLDVAEVKSVVAVAVEKKVVVDVEAQKAAVRAEPLCFRAC